MSVVSPVCSSALTQETRLLPSCLLRPGWILDIYRYLQCIYLLKTGKDNNNIGFMIPFFFDV